MNTARNCDVADLATGPEPVGGITDKKGFGARWGFSVRHVDTLLAQGLPHLAIGKRRIRIIVAEADAWMKDRFGTRRLGHSRVSTEKGT